jgi:hypothetical protein
MGLCVRNLGRFQYILISNITAKFRIQISDSTMTKYMPVFLLIPSSSKQEKHRLRRFRCRYGLFDIVELSLYSADSLKGSSRDDLDVYLGNTATITRK